MPDALVACLAVVPHAEQCAILHHHRCADAAGIPCAASACAEHCVTASGARPVHAIRRERIPDAKDIRRIGSLIPHAVTDAGGASIFAGELRRGFIADHAGSSDNRLVERGCAGWTQHRALGQRSCHARPVQPIGRGGEANRKDRAVEAVVPHFEGRAVADDIGERYPGAIEVPRRSQTEDCAAAGGSRHARPGCAIWRNGVPDAPDAAGVEAGIPHAITRRPFGDAGAGRRSRGDVAQNDRTFDIVAIECCATSAAAIARATKHSAFQCRSTRSRRVHPCLAIGDRRLTRRWRCQRNQHNQHAKDPANPHLNPHGSPILNVMAHIQACCPARERSAMGQAGQDAF